MELKTGKEILIEYNQQGCGIDNFLTLEEMIDRELEKAISIPIEPPAKAACETLQKRFDIYANAINQIDDFFEYRYERLDKDQIKEIVMNIIDGITLKLSKSV